MFRFFAIAAAAAGAAPVVVDVSRANKIIIAINIFDAIYVMRLLLLREFKLHLLPEKRAKSIESYRLQYLSQWRHLMRFVSKIEKLLSKYFYFCLSLSHPATIIRFALIRFQDEKDSTSNHAEPSTQIHIDDSG